MVESGSFNQGHVFITCRTLHGVKVISQNCLDPDRRTTMRSEMLDTHRISVSCRMLHGVKLISRDDFDSDGCTTPRSVMARRRGRSLSAGRVSRRRSRSASASRKGRSSSRGEGGSDGRGREQNRIAVRRAGSGIGSRGSEAVRGILGFTRQSRSADGARAGKCGWCEGKGGVECEVCGGFVLGDEVDRELTVVKEKVLDSLVRSVQRLF